MAFEKIFIERLWCSVKDSFRSLTRSLAQYTNSQGIKVGSLDKWTTYFGMEGDGILSIPVKMY